MYIRIYNEQTNMWSDNIYPRLNDRLVTYEDRFDEGYNTFSFQTTEGLLGGITLPIEENTKAKVVFDDGVELDGYVASCRDAIISPSMEAVVEISIDEFVLITKKIPLQAFNNSNELVNGTVVIKPIKEIIRRLNSLMWVRTTDDMEDKPLYINIKSNDWWVDVKAPELFYENQTVMEVLVDIGNIVGGRPKLTFIKSGNTITNGEYELTFLQWGNKDTAHYTDSSYTTRVRTTESEGKANYVVSQAKNMTMASVDDKSSITYPCIGREITTTSTSYSYEIDSSTRALKLPYKIRKILKVEGSITYQVESARHDVVDITDLVIDYNKWRTLPDHNWFESSYLNLDSRNHYLYYKVNENYICNIDEAKDWLARTMSLRSSGGTMPVTERNLILRVTYVPYIDAMVRVQNGDNIKPIGTFVNQSEQVISATKYSNYLDGLVKRMQGKYSDYTFSKSIAYFSLYKAGEWLNDELIVSAEHSFSSKTVISKYRTVPEFNRRSVYKSYPHQTRNWAIPEDNIDRTILFTENIECSIGVPLTSATGKLSASGKTLLGQYSTQTTKPSLVYLAFKQNSEIVSDNVKQNNGYGIKSLLSAPFGKSIVMQFVCDDNASIGDRGYRRGPTHGGPDRQQFIGYPPQAQYMQYKISATAPTLYNFDGGIGYTETGTGATAPENDNMNKHLFSTFPMSNKEQWTNASALGEWSFYIWKDLRDRIIGELQLDFIGKNNTIIYDGAITLSPLCYDGATTFKVFYGGANKYSEYTKLPFGTNINVSSVASSVIGGVTQIVLTLASQIPANTKFSICDSNNELMWATNTGLTSATNIVTVYLANTKKRYKKI